MTRPGEPSWTPSDVKLADLYSAFKADPVKFGDNTLVEVTLKALELTRRLASKASRMGMSLSEVLKRLKVKGEVERFESYERTGSSTDDL